MMVFNDWWAQYLKAGGSNHFNIMADEESARAAWNYQQARIDALMFECCPNEMTPEQIAEYERHQTAINE